MRSKAWGIWVVAVACVLLASATSANAANITSLIEFDPTGNTTNQISDDSVENITTFTGSLKVGDVIEGILNITAVGELGNLTNVGGFGVGATGNNELTAIFRTVVHRINFLHAGTDGFSTLNGDVDPGGPVHIDADDIYRVSFKPDDTWAAAAALGVAGGVGTGTGAMVIFFEDPTPDYTKSGPPAVDVLTANDGFYFWSLGMNTALGAAADSNAAGEGWVATTRLTLPPANNQIGTAVYSLNRVFSSLAHNGATPIPGIGEQYILDLQEGAFSAAGVKDVEVLGTTTFNSQVGNASGWNINNQAEFFVIPLSTIPLPAAAWMGMALLGALGIGRRLRRRT